ncbi:kinase-like domain-containing protein [Thamnocephalis sphaerospora]|uniref:non-specific serine/threonine protein kinase n=1 Tax=Thamnocephalis sphaerospora TaxID=78915 RepID=A0A4P9XVD2_9FUNG|nr:kinase-like domain-containing protein [Thamnocephalis sphaerospora]|eukprot:RKP10235.1 kinase-like domain-containing protein [Thamnocephalis sphaerospora]
MHTTSQISASASSSATGKRRHADAYDVEWQSNIVHTRGKANVMQIPAEVDAQSIQSIPGLAVEKLPRANKGKSHTVPALYFGEPILLKCATRENAQREHSALMSAKTLFATLLAGFPSANGQYCLIFKRPSGVSLRVYAGALSREQKDALLPDIFAQAITALKYMHRLNLAHGDIQPDNIMVWQATPNDMPQITIMNLEKSQRSKGQLQPAVAGTFGYRPPEDYLETRTNLLKRDSWMLGATLYDALTGAPPYGYYYSPADEKYTKWLEKYMVFKMRSIVELGENRFKPILAVKNAHLLQLLDALMTCRAEKRPTVSELDASLIFALAGKDKPLAYLGHVWSKVLTTLS